VTTDAGEDVDKEEHSSIAGGIASWYNKLEIVLLDDPTIPLLGIHPEDVQ
jgi:hypothetical protein